jgi:hypothetical protein
MIKQISIFHTNEYHTFNFMISQNCVIHQLTPFRQYITLRWPCRHSHPHNAISSVELWCALQFLPLFWSEFSFQLIIFDYSSVELTCTLLYARFEINYQEVDIRNTIVSYISWFSLNFFRLQCKLAWKKKGWKWYTKVQEKLVV